MTGLIAISLLARSWISLSAAWAAESPMILLIGDSHTVGAFGSTQDSLLRPLPGFRVGVYGSCGSSPHSWLEGLQTNCGYWFKDVEGKESRGKNASTPLIDDLLRVNHPRYTIVALGGNMYGAPAEWIERTSRELAQAIRNSGSRCIWISAPHARKKTPEGQEVVFQAIERAVSSECLLIDSRNFTHYPDRGGDGIHYDSLGESGREMARRWALGTYEVYAPELKSP